MENPRKQVSIRYGRLPLLQKSFCDKLTENCNFQGCEAFLSLLSSNDVPPCRTQRVTSLLLSDWRARIAVFQPLVHCGAQTGRPRRVERERERERERRGEEEDSIINNRFRFPGSETRAGILSGRWDEGINSARPPQRSLLGRRTAIRTKELRWKMENSKMDNDGVIAALH